MSAEQPLVLMMAGGTGGHVYPALAVAMALRERGYRVAWVGTAIGLEARVVPAADIELHCLKVRGVRGKSAVGKVLAALFLTVAVLQALWLIYRLGPKCVVGLGGYAAGPGGVAAWLLRKPVIIHEQNAVAGTTNRMLAPFARKILAGFPGAFATGVEVTTVGNPVRQALLDMGARSSYSYTGQRPLRLLVLGGSLGAKPINDLMPLVLQRLFEVQSEGVIEVYHQCGDTQIERVRASYGELLSDGVRVCAFIEDMAEAYCWADLVLCRAGALTVSELAITGRPSILVPLPHAIDDHQTANARSLSDRGAAILLRQAQMTSATLLEMLLTYLSSPQRLISMAQKAASAAIPDATEMVCKACEECIHGH